MTVIIFILTYEDRKIIRRRLVNCKLYLFTFNYALDSIREHNQYLEIMKISSCWYLLFGILIIQFFAIYWYRIQFVSTEMQKEEKYVGMHLNSGRLGNQLFHLITGYGIAKTLGRIHYLPSESPLPYALEYLQILDEVFPKLRDTYVLAANGANETLVWFANFSCCVYDNPKRLLNHTAKYLLLHFVYGQNPRYFVDYLPEIRGILQFSNKIRSEGRRVVDKLQLDGARMLCIHIRRTDFILLNVSTDANETVQAANRLAKQQGISRFMIFGDDMEFMRNLSKMIVNDGDWKGDAALVSHFNEATDLYLASEICYSFLITAATSTFGWWLAFFSRNQNAVYYMPDNRKHADKVPTKELYLTSWQEYIGSEVDSFTIKSTT